MPNLSIKIDSVCDGGDHLFCTVGFGPAKRQVTLSVDDLRGPITDDDVEAVCRVLLRLRVKGLGKAQAKTTLQQGLEIPL